jgi:hypothetical protein
MSLNDKKKALFSKTSLPPTSTGSTIKTNNSNLSQQNNSNTNNKHNNNDINRGSTSSINPAQKTKKLEEAKELISRATNHLQTTLFNWNPDYLAAAPLYEQASNIYKGLGDMDQARELLAQSSLCHQKSGSLSAAALALIKASEISRVNI